MMGESLNPVVLIILEMGGQYVMPGGADWGSFKG